MEFLLNGARVSISDIPVQTTLLDFIRDRGLTAAKEGCAEGECGACTVLLVGDGTYRPVNSCLLFVPMLAGQEIHTVESLARNGELTAAQQAMASMGGSQCGYCTPGFVASLHAEHYRMDRTGPCDPHSMAGNLCRCTGYRPIRDAALSLKEPPDDEFRRRLTQPAPKLEAIRYEASGAAFHRPSTLSECFDLMRDHPGAQWISGGTDLGVESNLRFRRWPSLISLEAVAELRQFAATPQSIHIGAALPLSDIAARWTNAPEAFRQWVPLFASPTLRNRATLGGNLGTASPVGDGAPLLIALAATLHLASPQGRRTVPLESFFTDYRRTLLLPDELIAAIEVPQSPAAFTRFYKAAKRRMDDISTVAAALSVEVDHAGVVPAARFAFGGVARTPWRALAAEEAVIGRAWNASAVARAQEALERTLSPISDHRGSAAYRREVAKSLVEKFWWEMQGA